MKKRSASHVDVNELSTWTKYRKGLCDTCVANCCTMPVEVSISDLIRMEVLDSFEAEEPIKGIAKILKKQGIVEHFNFKNEIFTLVRFANHDCLYLDSKSRRCTIYTKRPETCRNHPQIGPKPNFCPYKSQ